jgi:hypothetical protein
MYYDVFCRYVSVISLSLFLSRSGVSDCPQPSHEDAPVVYGYLSFYPSIHRLTIYCVFPPSTVFLYVTMFIYFSPRSTPSDSQTRNNHVGIIPFTMDSSMARYHLPKLMHLVFVRAYIATHSYIIICLCFL